MRVVLIVGAILALTLADMYLHNMRGSNNRLNEQSATRQNGNRMFDSQNNARGGYNTGDRFYKAAGNEPRRQYSMQYYGSGPTAAEKSKLLLEWTNQHGCGGNAESPHKLNCNVVVQMMCMSNGTDEHYPHTNNEKEKKIKYMRDGTSTNTQDYTAPNQNERYDKDQNTQNTAYDNRMKQNYENQVKHDRGLHETVWWYDMCRFREANGGLYIADQELDKNNQLGYVGSERTRQNNNGDRRGYECPEERDYYPYWQPTHQHDFETENTHQTTPWIDVAYLTGNLKECDMVNEGSENRNGKYRCVLGEESSRKYGRSINENDCTQKEEGTWVMFHSYLEIITEADTSDKCAMYRRKDKRNKVSWMALRSDHTEENQKMCVVQAPLPECKQAPWTRVNHLGNSIDSQGNASRYEMEMPYFPSGNAKRCVLRARYNISTDEYDGYNTDSDQNYDLYKGVISPVEQDPFIDVSGGLMKPLRLAMNTNQYGRTFQDRTHIFVVLPRTVEMKNTVIHNLNVRGKRGNIVQTFPAVEYDFIPSKLTVEQKDLVHIQWAGSNTHNNGGNGGDGQTGDAGEGTGGTDRHNFLQMLRSDLNYPLPYENAEFWDMVESVSYPEATSLDIALGLATSGYYCGYDEYEGCSKMYYKMEGRDAVEQQLNNSPASYFGHVLKFKKTGTCVYICTRNNNFTNRSQKGVLWVKAGEEEL